MINRGRRRATDVVLLGVSTIGIVLVGLIAVPEPGSDCSISRFLLSLPAALTGMPQVLGDLPSLWALVVLVAAFVHGKRTSDATWSWRSWWRPSSGWFSDGWSRVRGPSCSASSETSLPHLRSHRPGSASLRHC